MTNTIIIPAYNEEQRIGKTLEQYLNFFKEKNTKILVVMNGCKDNTLGVVKEYEQKYPNILKYLDIKEGIGKGGAVLAGFKNSDSDIVGFVDADDATSAIEYNKLITNIDDYDAVIASRWLKDSVVKNRTMFRTMISKIFVLTVKIIVGLPFSDTQCGAKIFKREVVHKILPELKITDMAFDVELLATTIKHGFKVKEISTVWVGQPSSATFGSPFGVFKSGLKMLKTLFLIRKGSRF